MTELVDDDRVIELVLEDGSAVTVTVSGGAVTVGITGLSKGGSIIGERISGKLGRESEISAMAGRGRPRSFFKDWQSLAAKQEPRCPK